MEAGRNKENTVKHLKILVLSAVAVAALTALVGAGTASAKTVLCTGSPPGTVKSANCPAGVHEWTWPAKTAITANATGAKLTTNLVNVICGASATSVTPETDFSETSITGPLTVSFTECKTEGSSTNNCTVTVENGPYTAHVEGTKGGNTNLSTIKVTNPKVHVSCGSLINCTYGQEVVELEGENGTPTTFTAKEVSIAKLSGTFCPTTSKWDAVYKTSSTITIH
jgi:hypothetical protein